MKSAAPFIAAGGVIVAVVAGVFLFGDQLGLTRKAEAPSPAATQTAAPASDKANVATSSPAADTKPAEEKKSSEQEVASLKTDTSEEPQKDVAVAKPEVEEPAAVAEETPKPVVPSFDVVRVEPDGQTLVAGKASPGWKVQLKNGEQLLASAEADANGDWVMLLDDALKEGVSDLSLSAQSSDGGEALASASNVTVARPEGGKGELLVVETAPGQASNVIAKVAAPEQSAAEKTEMAASSEAEVPAPVEEEVAEAPKPSEPVAEVSEAPAMPKETDVAKVETEAAPAEATKEVVPDVRVKEPEEEEASAAAIETSISIEAVEIEGDTLFVAGAAEPAGSDVRLYVDNQPISDSKSGETGRFLFDGNLSLDAGRHQARVDLLDPETGDVANRAEVSFEKSDAPQLSVTAKATGNEAGAGEGAAAASDAVKVKKVIIRRGDNLWQIARRVYGAGIRYSTIYDNNSDQIRDPHWIYPGQVFELPQGDADWDTNFDAIETPENSATSTESGASVSG